MATINLTVNGHEITCTNEEKPVLSQGSHNIDTVIFTYDSTYSGYTLYATMYQSMPDPVLVELSNNSCKIPIDALLYPGKVRIGLRAENSQGSVIATSCLEWFNVEPGAIDGSEGTSTSGIASLANRIAALESAISGDSVPTNVRQALFTLLNNAVYHDVDLGDEKAIIQSWAAEITAISVSPTTLRINGMTQETIVATTQPSGGIVTWSSSDESIATVAGGVVTPTGVNGSCTITASCGGKSATCAVTVSGFATLLSIEATYTQSGTVYDTDSLDSLKSDLVVTANYDDGRSVPVTDYALSGSLEIGTATIGVLFGGKTASFTVTVIKEPVHPLYEWDLTESLTDKVSGLVATTNATQGSTGLVFDTKAQYCDFGAIYETDRTYELDVVEVSTPATATVRRILMGDVDANTAYNGGFGIMYGRTNPDWGAYNGSAWATITDNLMSGVDFFNGKTLRVYVDTDRYWHIYANSSHGEDDFELVGTVSTAMKDIANGHVYIGGSRDDGIAPATFTALRVYEGEIE